MKQLKMVKKKKIEKKAEKVTDNANLNMKSNDNKTE